MFVVILESSFNSLIILQNEAFEIFVEKMGTALKKKIQSDRDKWIGGENIIVQTGLDAYIESMKGLKVSVAFLDEYGREKDLNVCTGNYFERKTHLRVRNNQHTYVIFSRKFGGKKHSRCGMFEV